MGQCSGAVPIIHTYISNGTIITPSRGLFDIVVFWLLLLFFSLSRKKTLARFCVLISFIKSEIITNFVLIMINCYSLLNISDSSYVVSSLHSVLISIINYISIIIIQTTVIIIIIIIILFVILDLLI